MVDLFVKIEVAESEDLDIVINAVKSLQLEKPVYILKSQGAYEIRYEADQYSESIELLLKIEFQKYFIVEELGVGQHNVKLSVKVSQSPMSTDNWGRLLNTDPITKTYYFLENEIGPEQTIPTSVVRVLFDREEREYRIYVTQVTKREDESQSGFIVTKLPFDESNPPQLLSKYLFKSPVEAFYDGFFRLTSEIEDDYSKFNISKKKKRKK